MEVDDSTVDEISISQETLLQQLPPPPNGLVDWTKIYEIEPDDRDSNLAKSMKDEMRREFPLESETYSIYRIHKRLRDINPIAYTPQMISIGPFHHGQEHLMAMERHKLHGLKIYLSRIDMSLEVAIAIARTWETRARGCYAESINMTEDDFVKMMLVDGCFLLEFMILVHFRFSPLIPSITLDCSFYDAMEHPLCYDLIMLENQLPLFVLEGLFNNLSAYDHNSLKNITFDIFIQGFIEIEYVSLSDVHPQRDMKTDSANHLVHLLSDYYDPTSLGCSKDEETRNFLCSIFSLFSNIISSFFSFLCQKKNNANTEQRKFLPPPTLTELWEAGVTIKKAAEEKHSMEISFQHGVLEIPHFEIDDDFESHVRNLMAFENYHFKKSKRYVTNYVAFLDGLISTEKDASLLVNAEILTNNIGGSHEEVYKLFNGLCKEITLPGGEYYYYDTTKALSKYCKALRHRWMASLRRDYFNTPWTCISLCAAILLIILTLIQTLYSHLSYSN